MGQLFGFAVLTMTGYATANEVLASGFGNATFLMVLLGAAFAECLNQIGVTEGIAYWLLSKKIFVGRPWLLIVALCVCAFLMSMGNGGVAAVFLLWTITMKIGEISGYKPGSKVLNMLIAFICYIAFYSAEYGSVLWRRDFIWRIFHQRLWFGDSCWSYVVGWDDLCSSSNNSYAAGW